jgi:type 1 glutamine amidotransferase
MKILLFCDDYYHPAQIAIDGLKPLAKKNFEICVAKNDFENFENFDVIILCKEDHVSQTDNSSWKTPAMQNAFVKYVENGGGLLVTHNGTVAGENTAVLDKLAGCRFTFHPNNCPVTVGALKPHPVTEGVNTFIETDEHYKLEILANDIDILAASYSDAQGEESKYESEPYFNAPACIAPAAYVRTQGKGRVCVLTPGHVIEVWQNPDFARLLENALRWCAAG